MSSNTLRNNERLSVISREHNFQHFLTRFERHLEFLKKIETDQMNELQQQLADALKVQESETIACKDLLIRRARAAANCAKCKRELDKATSQGKNVQQVAEVSRETNELLDLLSAEGKERIPRRYPYVLRTSSTLVTSPVTTRDNI
ncbi:Oidioi.mRNA.OKI2018_I69.PAR.g11767.t1.cds [Oikopleura dioica]|uniref:Oidioi.mRNA.OKI2018_I69.PAR.g11767.t1.cds n=1 Tax=Oikopleura dioica TaxID=34765 RepID=A0ABN7S062_OIKDI|nr:Oidioi.mRNA.OKI2018_I69.PAR.g11767.t1.cds [Oikopleura dioica]